MRCTKESMLLYAVTDRSWLGGSTLEEQVGQALKGGSTCIQLREKELDFDAFLTQARKLKSLCSSYQIPFIINDNIEVAISCQADGIHVGQHDMTAAEVRSLIGDSMILGVSVQTIDQALLAQNHGADYLGVGAVFSTATKADADNVSLSTLKAICTAVSIPVVAIGGINKGNIPQLTGTGIDGVALVSAIFAADNIEKECRELRQISERMVRS